MRTLRRAIRVLQISLLGEKQVQAPRRVAQARVQKVWRDFPKRHRPHLSRKDPPAELRSVHERRLQVGRQIRKIFG